MARNTLAVLSPGQFRAAMCAAGLDGKQLAKAANVSRQFVSLLARGHRRCSPAIAGRIARELNTTTASLFTSGDVSEESHNKEESEMPPAPVELDDPYLLFNEVAALTRIKPKTLRALRAKGEGPPFFKRGQILTIRRSAALAWFRETYEDAPAE